MEPSTTSISSVAAGPPFLAPSSTASASNKPTGGRSIGTALFLNLVVSNNVPIITDWSVELSSMKDLGKGGSYTVCSGNLAKDLDLPSKWIIRPTGGSKDSKPYAKGTSVAIKTINHHYLEATSGDSVDLASLATEVSILSDPWIRACPLLVDLVGVGWAPSAYDETESPRYWPYILTEFGNRGTLEDYFRSYHRGRAPHRDPAVDGGTFSSLPSTKGAVSVDWKSHMPWDLKLVLAFSVAQGLHFLHGGGVVHGDVKFSNTVVKAAPSKEGSETTEVKLCDFGSSILLSGYDDPESESFLRSRTEPWDAPESKNPIKRDNLTSTDIYSFGLLFARIMLDGNDPFDESFHVASGNNPVYNITEVNKLKARDEVVSHIQQRLSKMELYSPEQMKAIMAVLKVTVIYKVEKRVACIGQISELLLALLGAGKTDKVAKPNLDNLLEKCSHDACIDKDKRAVKCNYSIPNLLQQELQVLLVHTSKIIEEVFLDLEKISEATIAHPAPGKESAQAMFQLAMCHLHGWGTMCSPTDSLEKLGYAGLLDSEEALKGFMPLANALGVSIPEETRAPFLTRLEVLYPESNDRVMAEALLEIDPETYKSRLNETRTRHLDLTINQRYLYPNRYNDNVAVNPRLTFGDGTEFTDLHYACASGKMDAVRTLILSEQIDVNARTHYGHTPLWLACNCGHASVVQLLLDAGADASIPDLLQGMTPLHFLARFDPEEIPEIASSLVSHGGDVNAKSTVPELRELPLEYIFDAGRNFCAGSVVPAVQALLDNGASPCGDLDIFDTATRALSSCPLLRAMWSNNAEAFLAIFNRIVVTESKKARTSSARRIEELFDILRAKCFMIFGIKSTWFRIIESGADYYSNLLTILTHILTPEARKHFKRLTGYSPLSIASKQGHDIFEVIVAGKLYSTEDCLDSGLLKTLFSARKTQAVARLIDTGTDFSASNKERDNFLHLAAKNAWRAKYVMALCSGIEGTVDLRKLVNTPNAEHETPFDAAVMRGHFQLADFLHSLGAEIDVERPNGNTTSPAWLRPLNFTSLGKCLAGEAEMPLKLRRVRYILKFNPNLMISSGLIRFTAFHAIWIPWSQQRKRHISPESTDVFSNDLLDLLLDHYPGTEAINMKDALGVTPLHMAAAAGNKIGVKRLLDRGALVNSLDNGNSTPRDHVGDELYRLASGGKRQDVKHGESESSFILYSKIEVYILLEVMGLLDERGGLPGVTCVAQGAPQNKLDAHSAVVERLYKKAAKAALAKRTSEAIQSKVGDILTFGLVPPDGRHDLGGHFMRLKVDDHQLDLDEDN